MSAPEAERQARLMLGGVEQIREQCRDARGTRWIEDAVRDMRYTCRTLRKSPAFAAVAILSLARDRRQHGDLQRAECRHVETAAGVRPSRLASPYHSVDDDDRFTYLYWEEIRKRYSATNTEVHSRIPV